MEGHEQLHPTDGSPPPYEIQRKPRGCLFYGCLVAIVLAVIAAILLGLGATFFYRSLDQFVKDYAEDTPRPVPVAELPADELDALKARLTAFQEGLEAHAPTEPLELTATQVNALIDADPDYKGIVAFDFTGDQIQGQISFPLDRISFFGKPLFPGKYINGTAIFDIRIDNGLLLATIDAITVKGKPVPEDFMSKVRVENLAKDSASEPENAKLIAQIERIEVKDGKLRIIPKRRPVAKDTIPKPDGPLPEAKPALPAKAEAKAAA
jgi:hypothetical protein